MKRDIWNKCQVCGRIIGYAEFTDGRAVHEIIAPSSEFSDETYDTYHVKCDSPEPPK